MSTLEVTILGCGPSSGVPRLGGPDMAGDWGHCDPENPKNRRRRCSVLVQLHSETGTTRLLVDTSPDLREQLLRAHVAELDAVLISHDHADQLHGLDDLRQVTHFMHRRVQVHTDANTAETVLNRFSYCFVQPPDSGYQPIADLHIIAEPLAAFEIGGAGGPIPVLPFWQQHGDIRSLGFRFGPVAYSPDVNALDETAFAALDGVDTWIVDALRQRPHPSHTHVELALEWIARVKARRGVLTNMNPSLDYETLKRELPPDVEPAFDGLTVSVAL
jgi:phosphoribosyl 1,2-cyclic phosphate phosphodiesterase